RDTAGEVGIMGLPSNRQALQQRLRDRIVAMAQVEELIIVGADGTVFAAAGQHPPVSMSPGGLAYFAQHRDGRARGLYVSEAFRQPGNGRWTVAVSRRIEGRDDAFLGIVAAYLDLDYFDRFYDAVDLGP